MTDPIEFLKTRRSVKPREMSGPGPSADEIDTILTIGARVPDHGKLAPWRFIVFEGKARARAGEVTAEVFARKNPQSAQADIDIEKRRLMDAPLVIAVVSFVRPHPKVPEWEQQLSAGASAMNIVTAATALGYGANWLTGWFAFDRDVLDGLGLKPDEKIAGFIHIGTPTKPNEDRPRRWLSDIVTRFWRSSGGARLPRESGMRGLYLVRSRLCGAPLKKRCTASGTRLTRHYLNLAVDAVDDVEGTLEHLAFVLGDGAIFAFGQDHAREGADGFLDDVTARRDHRPGGVGQRLAALVADQFQSDHRGAVRDDDVGQLAGLHADVGTHHRIRVAIVRHDVIGALLQQHHVAGGDVRQQRGALRRLELAALIDRE